LLTDGPGNRNDLSKWSNDDIRWILAYIYGYGIDLDSWDQVH
jgi:hypothetical protein